MGMKKKKKTLFGKNRRDTTKKLGYFHKDIEEEYDDLEQYEEEEYTYEEDTYLEEEMYDDEYMDDDEEMYDDEYIDDEAEVYDDEYIDDEAEVYDDEDMDDEAEVYADEYMDDEAEIYADEYDDEADDRYYPSQEYEDYAEDSATYYEDDEEWEEDAEDDCYYANGEDDDAFDTEFNMGRIGRRHSAGRTSETGTGQLEKIAGALKSWLQHMTPFDVILTSLSVVILAAALVTFSMVYSSWEIEKQIDAIVPVGTQLSEVGVVGQSGLLAMTDAAMAAQAASEIEAEQVIESTQETEEEEAHDRVTVSFESVERDLKIRFRNAQTGAFITGTTFEVTLTNNSSGKELILKDDDQDGVIYATNVTAGTFSAVITSTDKYKFPTTPQQVKVKDKVEYVVINVEDEVKNESQVNVAVEDTEKQAAATEEIKLTDTVEWVESSKTLVSGTEGYLLIDKSTIADPSVSARAGSAAMRFDAVKVELNKSSTSLYAGSSETLVGTSYQDYTEGDSSYSYTMEWKSSNDAVATVSNGVVSAKAAGTATITYTITKKTVTKTEISTGDSEKTEELEISIEDYDALEDAEKEKCSPLYDESGSAITKYLYKKVTVEPGTTTTETKENTETGSATCEVTVQNIAVTAGTLELAKSADSCNVKATLTVKPSKLVYTKNDGSTQTITEGFPAITWSSSDTSIATIDANGVVTGVKAGIVTITGQVKGITDSANKELDIKATTSVTIHAAASLSLTLDRTSGIYIAVGKSTTLVPTVTNYQSDNGVTWVSSDTKIATVNEKGVVTGVAAGSVTITATTKEKDITSGKVVTATSVVTVNSDATGDKTTKLKDKNGNQVYIKDANGNYIEAVYADYFTASEFYIKTEGQYTYTGWQTLNGKTYYYDKTGKVVTGTQIIQGVTYNFGSDGAIQTTVNGSTFGIDVSKWNGKIDWNAVKSSGVDYVIVRCGYRGSSTGALIEDPYFKQNMQGATAAGIKVGVYLFSQAINEVEAVKEASFAISLAKSYNLTYPIFIDTEPSGGRADGLNAAARTAVVSAFCQTVENSGYRAGIYASKSWFESKLQTASLSKYKIWLAQYAAAPTYGGKYDLWQYSSKGTISGINGNVDLNLSYLGY